MLAVACCHVAKPHRGDATLLHRDGATVWHCHTLCAAVAQLHRGSATMPRCNCDEGRGRKAPPSTSLRSAGVGVCLRQRQGEGREGHPRGDDPDGLASGATAPAGPPVIAPAAASGRIGRGRGPQTIMLSLRDASGPPLTARSSCHAPALARVKGIKEPGAKPKVKTRSPEGNEDERDHLDHRGQPRG